MYRKGASAYDPARMVTSGGAIRKRLGRRLLQLRAERRLTQEELAGRAGLAPKYLGEVERGRANISVDRLDRLAAALEVDPVDLLAPEEERGSVVVDRAIRRAADLLRKSGGGQRRLMLQILEDVAEAYGRRPRK